MWELPLEAELSTPAESSSGQTRVTVSKLRSIFVELNLLSALRQIYGGIEID